LQKRLSQLFYACLAVAMVLSVAVVGVLANHGHNLAYGLSLALMTVSFVGSMFAVALADEWLGKHNEAIEDALAVAFGERSPSKKRQPVSAAVAFAR